MECPPMFNKRWYAILHYVSEKGTCNRTDVYGHYGNVSKTLKNTIQEMLDCGLLHEEIHPLYNIHNISLTDLGRTVFDLMLRIEDVMAACDTLESGDIRPSQKGDADPERDFLTET